MAWSFVVLSAALLFAIPHGVAAQAPDAAPPLRQSLQSLSVLLARVPSAPASLSFATWRARTALTRPQELSTKWPAESPADYRANVGRQVTLFEQTLAANDAVALAAFLEALGDDLEVKLEHCRNSGGRLGGSVTVSVRTVQGSRELRDWHVFYLPKVLEASGVSAANRFPQLSSPTNDTLVPGRYVMWVRDASGDRTGERVVVKVGEGRKELVLDLPVPAPTSR
jgi:hypothetical protein